MTSTPSPAAVAATLTKAQAKALLAMTERWQRPSKTTFSHGAAWGLFWTGQRLVDHARIGTQMASAHDEFRILPLGIAVRAEILKGEG